MKWNIIRKLFFETAYVRTRQHPTKLLLPQPHVYKHSPSRGNLTPQSPWPRARLNPEQAAQPRASSEYAHTKTQHAAPLGFILSSSFVAVSASKLCTATERRHENKFNHISSFQERLAPHPALAQGRQQLKSRLSSHYNGHRPAK